jgi:hypothetical protein
VSLRVQQRHEPVYLAVQIEAPQLQARARLALRPNQLAEHPAHLPWHGARPIGDDEVEAAAVRRREQLVPQVSKDGVIELCIAYGQEACRIDLCAGGRRRV